MKKRHTEEQIISILKEVDGGIPVNEVTRKYNLSSATIYKWRQKYNGMETNELRRLKQLEDENRRLKQLVADQALNIQVLEHVVKKY